jgi:peptidoglycan/xylan/chitin deacetylase (PgdA/CDA1 family)
MQVIFDLDDYSVNYNCLTDLIKLKREIPNLKVTLFTIPTLMDHVLYRKTLKYDWIELALHGYDHLFPNGPKKGQLGSHEFAFLSKAEALNRLIKGYNSRHYVRGFKAPGWQINKGSMEALKELGFWIAIQFDDERYYNPDIGQYQPLPIEGLKYYHTANTDKDIIKIHGHTWGCCKNSIKDLKPKLLQFKDLEFITINQFIKQKYE